MNADFLEQLAQLDVPEPPAEFDRQLHERVNRSLVVQHVMDLVLGAAPWALAQFARAVAGAVVFSVGGDYPEDRLGKTADRV
jgi:hypothetical protein